MDLDAKMSVQTQKLMWMLSCCSFTLFELRSPEEQAGLAAVFGISATELEAAKRDFAETMAAFTEERQRQVAQWQQHDPSLQ